MDILKLFVAGEVCSVGSVLASVDFSVVRLTVVEGFAVVVGFAVVRAEVVLGFDVVIINVVRAEVVFFVAAGFDVLEAETAGLEEITFSVDGFDE